MPSFFKKIAASLTAPFRYYRKSLLDAALLETTKHYPATAADKRRIATLIRKGANPNAFGGEPLQTACFLGSYPIVDILLKLGASSSFVDADERQKLRRLGFIGVLSRLEEADQKLTGEEPRRTSEAPSATGGNMRFKPC